MFDVLLQVTHYMWQMTGDTWTMTCDTGHLAHDKQGVVNIVSKFYVSSSHGFGVMTFEDLEEMDDPLYEWINI